MAHVSRAAANRIKENIRWWTCLHINNLTVLCDGKPSPEHVERIKADSRKQWKNWLLMAKEYGA